MPIVKGLLVPGLPHPLLCPEKNEGWQRLADGFAQARQELVDSGAELLLIYSTMWPSVIGHQIQADPEPEWVHVDELFHALGSVPYSFRVDAGFAHSLKDSASARGLQARTVAYHGFPIDTGSVVALKLLNPDNRLAAGILSSNVYADRAETVVFGKACRDAIDADPRKIAVCVVSTLSNRLFTDWIEPHEDRIHSAKDEEWNRKLLQFLGEGRLEDTAQLSREIHRQIRVRKVVNFKPMWWLSAVMGQHNRYEGRVHAYAPLFGTGGAVVSLTPSARGVGDKEFDEEDVEVFSGGDSVLRAASQRTDRVDVAATQAPAPVGAYPHARHVGDLLFLSGVGPRQAGTDAIPGGSIEDPDYDIQAQVRACIENVKAILEASGSCLEDVVDVTSFLVDMDRDFAGYNAVYAEYFANIGPTRTTLAIRALPTPIAVELKVIARPGGAGRPAP